MDLTYTEEQRWLRAAAAEFLAARANTAGARSAPERESGFCRTTWSEMAALGWLGLALPEAYGGAGGDLVDLSVVLEELGRWLLPTPLVPTMMCASGALLHWGSEEQRQRWLGEIVEGRVWAPVAIGDIGGHDVVLRTSGTDFLLGGSAMFVPYADAAAELLVVARAANGTATALAVPAHAPGVLRERLDVMGHDRSYRVRFRDVRVPAERVIGAAGDGDEVADSLAAVGAALTCAEMVGGAQQVLDMTVRYAGQRTQFGEPIGRFQSVQNHCADMAVDVLGSRFASYEAIWRLATGRRAELEVAAAKAWVSEAYDRVCARGHQVHGAIGFTREHDLHLYTRHAMSTGVAFGDGDVHLDRVATELGL